MQSSSKSPAGVLLFILLLLTPTAPAFCNARMKALKRRQKQERSQLRQQQRATRKVMAQHAISPEARRRFHRNLKMQRQLLKQKQKEERRLLKHSRPSRHPRQIPSLGSPH